MFIGIIAAFDLPVAQLFLRMSAGDQQRGNAVDGINGQAETVYLVLNRQFQRRIDTN
jgi:hypothetical protein